MKFSKWSQALTPSATMGATLRAQELIRQGHDIVLATVGEPDGDVSQEIKQSLIQEMESKPSRYGSSQGLLSTRQEISKWFQKVYDCDYPAQNILITPGSKFALYALMQLLCDKGDKVLVPAPYWVSYITLAELAGANAVVCPPDENYKLTATVLKQNLDEKSKVLFLNSPNNPSGAVYSQSELKKLAQALEDYPQVTVICDDIYNQLVFSDSKRSASLLDVASEKLKERIIIVHGVSKSYNMTGWRLGWVAAQNSECIQKMNSFCSQSLTCVPDFIQKAAETALKTGDSFVQEAKIKNEKRHLWMQNELKSLHKIQVYKSEGAFYLWIRLNEKNKTSGEVVDELLQKGLATVSGDAFGMPYHLRLSLALSDQDLQKTAQRLKDYFGSTT